jgi:TldD protein
VRAAEAAARAVDPRIRQVKVTYGDRLQEVFIASSLGLEVSDARPYIVLAVHCVAADGDLVQTGYETAGGLAGLELLEESDPEEVARIAARRALLQLEADPAPGGSMPVVLGASAGGTMIHEAVGHGLEGDHINENMSVYAGKLGQQVASPLVSVADDSTIPGRRGSYGFDDEGVPSQNTLLIEKGVLKAYMQDRLSAFKMGAEPTGNGRRESYRFRPVPRMSNTLILSGDDDPQAVLSETPSGLYVAKMGGGQVNTVNGDFVFEVAEGYLIENGAIGKPVRGATLTGNGPKVLMEIDRVANDLGYSLGTCGKDGQGSPVADAQPTLRIPNLVVGGMHQG